MNPKESLRSLGKGVINTVFSLYKWPGRMSAELEADMQRMKEEAVNRYLNFVISREEAIFRTVRDTNLPQSARLTLPEEVRRKWTDFLNSQLVKMSKAGEGLEKSIVLSFRKDPETIKMNRILGLHAAINFWEDALSQPDLTVAEVFIANRRLTQLNGDLENLMPQEVDS